MQSKTLVVLSAVAILCLGSTAMAKGGGGGGWSHAGMHGGKFMHGHGHFDHRFARRFFNRGLFNNVNGWGWDWGLGGYGDSGYGNTTIVTFPQAKPQTPDVTGSAGPCGRKTQTFSVPSSAGGTRPVEVVSCR